MAAPLPQAGVLIINNSRWIMRGLSGFCLYRLIHLWFTGLTLLLLLLTLANQAAVFIITKIVCAEDIAVQKQMARLSVSTLIKVTFSEWSDHESSADETSSSLVVSAEISVCR